MVKSKFPEQTKLHGLLKLLDRTLAKVRGPYRPFRTRAHVSQFPNVSGNSKLVDGSIIIFNRSTILTTLSLLVVTFSFFFFFTPSRFRFENERIIDQITLLQYFQSSQFFKMFAIYRYFLNKVNFTIVKND